MLLLVIYYVQGPSPDISDSICTRNPFGLLEGSFGHRDITVITIYTKFISVAPPARFDFFQDDVATTLFHPPISRAGRKYEVSGSKRLFFLHGTEIVDISCSFSFSEMYLESDPISIYANRICA